MGLEAVFQAVPGRPFLYDQAVVGDRGRRAGPPYSGDRPGVLVRHRQPRHHAAVHVRARGQRKAGRHRARHGHRLGHPRHRGGHARRGGAHGRGHRRKLPAHGAGERRKEPCQHRPRPVRRCAARRKACRGHRQRLQRHRCEHRGGRHHRHGADVLRENRRGRHARSAIPL